MMLPWLGRVLIVLFVLFVPFTRSVNAQTATPTNTPTSTPTTTPTPTTPTNNAPYCASLTSDITTAIGTPQTVTFTCAGVDPGGDITAAEFTFGDGTAQTISKNVGSPGSISVTHTYNTIGTLGASCRVRDNDQVFSATTGACKRVITIRPKPIGITVPTSAIISSTPTLAITTTAPIPEPTIDIQPTLYPEDEPLADGNNSTSRFWWILGAAVSFIIGFLLLRRKKAPPVETPVMQPPAQTGQPGTPPPPEPPSA